MPKIILDVKLYSSQETAELLGVGTATLTNYKKKGRIKATKISGKYYYTEENIKQFLQTAI